MKRKRVRSKFGVEKRVEKNVPFTLLVISIFFLGVLSAAFMGVKVNEKNSPEKALGGELGTLKWDFNEEYVRLDVLNYDINESNLSLKVNINWSQGNKNVASIFLKFNGIDRCNHTFINDLNFGQNKTYLINHNEVSCKEASFENVTSISAYGQVHVNLTQTGLIPNITFYKDDSREDLINLDRYFFSLVNISYSTIESPSNNKIEIGTNSITHSISISTLDSTFNGTQKFNLIATSDDGEVLDVANSGENMSFYITVINTTRPIANRAPEFNSTYCDNLQWNMNNSYLLELEKCFYDEDNDGLTFRYDNMSNTNLIITRATNNLTLIPATNWNGTGYFGVYANDSKEETEGRVDFKVKGLNVSGSGAPVTTILDPVIRYSTPESGEVHIFDGNKTFSISAENYENIKWYLNGQLFREGGLTYNFTGLKNGDIVRADIINGTRMDSKTWKIVIEPAVEEQAVSVADMGQVIFYLIIGIIIIIIFLVVWLLLSEKNKRKNKVFSGFGISETKTPPREFAPR